MEARRSPDAGVDLGLRFERDGRTYVGELALSRMHQALDDTDLALMLAQWRRALAPVVAVSGGIAAALGLLIVAAAFALGRAGRRSREALISGFSLVRRALPALLILLVAVSAIGIVAALSAEALAFINIGDPTPRRWLLLGAGLGAVAANLYTGVRAVLQLGRVAGLFTPEPLVVTGRPVSRQEAPGLWQLATTLAGRLGAEPPDTIVVGLVDGFFAVAGPVRIEATGQILAGNTLHVPLPYLAFHRADEIAVIIGHELSHFAGQDTAYSKRFAPIHAGVGRAIDALLAAGTTRDGTLALLVQPALRLALFALDQFHHAMQGWSRRREFEADAASARLVSPAAAAGAMLRHDAVRGLIDDVLDFAWAHPAEMPADLVAFAIDRAQRRGLDDPTGRFDGHTPHPTDSHPPTRERFAAFGVALSDRMIAEATAVPGAEAPARLATYLADPAAISRDLSARFLARAVDAAAAERAGLEAQAAAVDDTAVSLYENTTPIAVLIFIIAAFHVGGGAALAALGVPGLDRETTTLVGMGFVAAGLAYVFFGLRALRRGRVPFLVLRQDALLHRHLDRPIAWAEVETLEVYDRAGSMVTGLLLHENAPLPRRTGGGRRVRLDPRRRLITFTAVPPRAFKVQGYAELMYRYHDADQVRRILAQPGS